MMNDYETVTPNDEFVTTEYHAHCIERECALYGLPQRIPVNDMRPRLAAEAVADVQRAAATIAARLGGNPHA
jgi:hypothetical protein